MKVKRNKQIDGIRGVTAIVILIYHLFCRYLQIYENGDIVWMSNLGIFGVTIFILISGYLLGLENIKEKSNSGEFKLGKYLYKKIIRLWICYVIAITLTMIIVKIFGLPGRECSLGQYLLNIFFINGFIGEPYVDGAHWYLTTLIAITIIIGIVKKMKLNKNVWFFVVWMIGVALLIKTGYGNITTLVGGTYIGVALVGYALANLINNKEKKIIKNWIILFIVSIVFCYIVQGVKHLIILALSTVIVTLCLLEKVKVFENVFFLKLGDISYPLYLIHQNIGYVIIRELNAILGTYKIYYSIIASIITILMAIGIYYLEKLIRENISHLKWQNEKEKV